MSSENNNKNISRAWDHAVEIYYDYCRKPVKADVLVSQIPNKYRSEERKSCQYLFFATIKNARRIEWELGQLISRDPRPKLRALLHVALGEIITNPSDRSAKVVDYAVGSARRLFSKKESGMVNAVLRKAVKSIEDGVCGRDAGDAVYYSHPDWMLDRWLLRWDKVTVNALLAWNQSPSPFYARLWDESANLENAHLEITEWHGFYLCERWSELVENMLRQGKIYIQDPSTRVPTDLLAVKPGEKVLDLCAAPGGKSVAIAHALGFSKDQAGLLVSLESSRARIKLLRENLRHFPEDRAKVICKDLFELDEIFLKNESLPLQYDAVLLDAPCSNTGVLRRRPDARWRLNPSSIDDAVTLQLAMMHKAAQFLRRGGRFVYSTCSIESEENEGLVAKFLEETDISFRLVDSRLSLPWVDGHDGGGAFLLERLS